ncbi:MAG: hypothetical protein HQK77_11700 [Desulfobacterales bacterium]|nr:hypothetical protein [Desulfobacterales bacterium]
MHQISPFDNVRVSEPREIETEVRTLNEHILENLLREFKALVAHPIPRKSKINHAQFIVSPQPGYGKSHLIGRLFKNLRGQATLIYIRPFEDSNTCWKWLLLKMVQEMTFPDSAVQVNYNKEEPNQLETLAHGIFTHLLIDGIQANSFSAYDQSEPLPILSCFQKTVKALKKKHHPNQLFNFVEKHLNKQINKISKQYPATTIIDQIHDALNKIQPNGSTTESDLISLLSNSTVVTFRNNANLLKIIAKHFNLLVEMLSAQVERHHIPPLNASIFTWLSVLFRYAYFPLDLRTRETCLEWLQGGMLDQSEAGQIGIRLKDIPPEMWGSEINEYCKLRILDFCQLAGFFRPFLFCFDQTENYGKSDTLAKTLGIIIQTFVDVTPNQMTVITANQHAWSRSIKPHWEEAHQHRLSETMELEGVNKEQSTELLNLRLKSYEDSDPESVELFYKKEFSDWLTDLFQDKNQLGIREFLSRANIRWLSLNDEETSEKIEHLPLIDYYQKCIDELESHPKRMVFDPNIFYWLVSEVSSGLSVIVPNTYVSARGYFTFQWHIPDPRYYFNIIYFGFESGSNWRKWESIVREATIHYDADSHIKVILFRTPELASIPSPTWKIAPIFDNAKETYLHIMEVSLPDLVSIYAGYDLYMDAQEGNIPYFPKAVLEFLREQYQGIWNTMLEALAPEK